MDLMERFDVATEGGPEHPPIESRLSDGRRALRRRRRSVGAAALATLAIVGTGWAMMPDGSVRGAEVTGAPPASGDPEVEQMCRVRGTTGGVTTYVQTQDAQPGGIDLDDCIEVRTVGSRDAAGRPQVNPFATFVDLIRGDLVTADGVTIVDSIRDPDVAGYSRRGVDTAAVTVRYDGETWFVLTSDGSLRQRLGRQSPATPTLEAFLAAKASAG